jgi:uncharacterized protein YndB with AHSA1/START domain
MTTPDVLMRIEFSIEVPGTPEQVWAAISTSEGLSSWFLPTDVDEREGGTIVIHMGESDSPAVITGWDPPRRLVYEEPEWAEFTGHPGAEVTPLASEFLIEARSGGTCVVRVVSSAFGTGADWEDEFMTDMKEWWQPSFDLLRLYLDRFPGQTASRLDVRSDVKAPATDVRAAIDAGLGDPRVGDEIDALGLAGRVVRADRCYVFVNVEAPVPGYLSVYAIQTGDGLSSAIAQAWLFGADAPGVVDDRTPAWQQWLGNLQVDAAMQGER